MKPITDRKTGIYISPMLDLSTAHVPNEDPDFGGLRTIAHKYGWIVFCPISDTDINIPNWIRPHLMVAWRHDCILINFDQAAETYDTLPTWEW